MESKGGVSVTITRRAAWRTAVALLAMAPAVALLGWGNTAAEASAPQDEQVAPAAAVQAMPAIGVQADPGQMLLANLPGADGTLSFFDIFIEIEGIEGESPDGGPAPLPVESWSFGVSQAGSHGGGGGGGAGKASFSDLSFTTKTSKASPMLMLRCATGQHIKKASLTVRKAGETPRDYLVITLEDVLVSSYQTGGSSGGGVAMDQVSLSFGKILYSVNGAKAGYDLKTNKGA